MPLNEIELLILDVDGVLADGAITLGNAAIAGDQTPIVEQGKRFHVQDGYAVKLWSRAGGRVAILSSRSHPAVIARAAELSLDPSLVLQGQADKASGFEKLIELTGLAPSCVAYMGDDLPDAVCLQRAGMAIAVANAHPSIKRMANYVTRRRGGEGAVAEVVELILRKQGRWNEVSGSPDRYAG